MIGVLFQGGTHGNYLEFVLNRFLAKIPVSNKLPFNNLGAAHSKNYLGEKQFQAHESREQVCNQPVVIVRVEHEDLLPLICVSLLRTGDFNTDPELLDIDTYNRMDNPDYRPVRDFIQQVFFVKPLIDSYQQVAQANWPKITSFNDYDQLPVHIKHKCEHVYGLVLNRFDADHPHCPRHILREFYKLSFLNPCPGQIIDQNELEKVDASCVKHLFPYRAFYSTKKFQQAVLDVANWLNLDFDINNAEFLELHQEFLNRQPYRDSKETCDNVVARILAGEEFDLPKLNPVQEGYVDAQLEFLTQQLIPVNQTQWFVTANQVRSALQII
jgi:hypothetical protein